MRAETARPVETTLRSVTEVSRRIRNGERLILAGDETLLSQLPPGHWIGGTIPYFMAEDLGIFSKEKIFVTTLPPGATGAELKVYTEDTIGNIYLDAPANGVSVVIIPAWSSSHLAFALKVTSCAGFATRPLIGWVSGRELGARSGGKPQVYCGEAPRRMVDGAVVMHIALENSLRAEINTINLFEQDEGDTIMVLDNGLTVSDVLVNGETVNFAEYLRRRKVDVRFPLVADYFGSMINISFRSVHWTRGEVSFYAPVFKGVEYKLAKPIEDYAALFTRTILETPPKPAFFSCNCILNYLQSSLEGQRMGPFSGPVTFGEIAYQLLNQTLVYVHIKDC